MCLHASLIKRERKICWKQASTDLAGGYRTGGGERKEGGSVHCGWRNHAVDDIHFVYRGGMVGREEKLAIHTKPSRDSVPKERVKNMWTNEVKKIGF